MLIFKYNYLIFSLEGLKHKNRLNENQKFFLIMITYKMGISVYFKEIRFINFKSVINIFIFFDK